MDYLINKCKGVIKTKMTEQTDNQEYKIVGVNRVSKIKVSNKRHLIEVFFENGESKLFDFEYFME